MTKSKPFFLLLVVGVCFLGCYNNSETEFDKAGRLKYTVPLINGVREGKMIVYDSLSNVIQTSYWRNGHLHGETILYYDNNIVKQKQGYVGGVIFGKAYFYRRDGSLQEIHYFNAIGKRIDYEKYHPDGSRDFRTSLIKAVIASKSDTVSLGEYFECDIRLGNRRTPGIEVLLGDFKGGPIQGLKQPKKDSVTAYVKIRATSPGENILSGVILAIDSIQNDSTMVVPFKYPYFVQP